jgi:hypothetical protein
MEKVLLKSDTFNGQYVALRSVEDNTVIGSGDTPHEAVEKAHAAGVADPMVLYVPKKDSVHIY